MFQYHRIGRWGAPIEYCALDRTPLSSSPGFLVQLLSTIICMHELLIFRNPHLVRCRVIPRGECLWRSRSGWLLQQYLQPILAHRSSSSPHEQYAPTMSKLSPLQQLPIRIAYRTYVKVINSGTSRASPANKSNSTMLIRSHEGYCVK
jgi:hypothetical protein